MVFCMLATLKNLFPRSPAHALCHAAHDGNTAAVEAMLRKGANPNANDGAPLLSASEHGHADIVEVLLRAGAQSTIQHNRALEEASYRGHTDVVVLLLQNGANATEHDSLCLRLASEKGHLEIVKILLSHGADAKAHNSQALACASLSDALDVFDVLYPLSDAHVALQWMVEDGRNKEERHMLERCVQSIDLRTTMNAEVAAPSEAPSRAKRRI